MEQPSIQSFFQWIQSSYTEDNHTGGTFQTVDQIFDRDIKGYKIYLMTIGNNAREEFLNIGGDFNQRRDFHDIFLIDIMNSASTQIESFTARVIDVRNRPYNFEPRDPAIQNLAEYCLEFFPEGLYALPVDERAKYYDYYGRFLRYYVNAQLAQQYRLSRQIRTEGDRRELYGFTRGPDTQGLQELHTLRAEIREVMPAVDAANQRLDNEDDLFMELSFDLQSLCSFIASELEPTEDKLCEIRDDLRRARVKVGPVGQLAGILDNFSI